MPKLFVYALSPSNKMKYQPFDAELNKPLYENVGPIAAYFRMDSATVSFHSLNNDQEKVFETASHVNDSILQIIQAISPTAVGRKQMVTSDMCLFADGDPIGMSEEHFILSL